MTASALTRLIPVQPRGITAEAAPDFVAASQSVMRFLHARMGFDLWMVTRTEGDDWIVLQSEDHGYGVTPRTVFRWADSFCSQMIAGEGPRLAPRSEDVPAYAAAPIGRQVKIGAYIGVPLTYTDGSLFGTLCAIHPTPRTDVQETDLPLIELLAGMLSSILNAELKGAEVARLAERHREAAEVDELTGLYNRRGWNRLLSAEEERCQRYAYSASVFAIDLDGLKQVNDQDGHVAGDALIVRAARTLIAALPASGLSSAVASADQVMYERKSHRKVRVDGGSATESRP